MRPPGVKMLGQAEAFLEALQDSGDADLDELVEVAGGDGEEFDALEQGVWSSSGLFEDAAIELQPALVAVDEATVPEGSRASWGAGCWSGAVLCCCAVCFRQPFVLRD